MKKMVTTLLTLGALGATGNAFADATYQTLPFTQNWTNIGLITLNDDWSGVPGILGFRGDDITIVTGTDPQTLTADDSPGVLDVNANQTNPATFNTGGVTEYHIADPSIGMTGSGTGDAPYILIHINTTGMQNILVGYTVRDLEASADNAVQQVALQFRVGGAGPYTNVPAAYVADGTTVTTDTQTTGVFVPLPAAANNQAQLQLRIMTTNAPGNDENIGIDNITVEGTPIVTPAASSSWGAIKSLYR